MGRRQSDIEKVNEAAEHLSIAIGYLCGCENPDRILVLLTQTRKLREVYFTVAASMLPRRPGEEH
jgi:hypothetical protein